MVFGKEVVLQFWEGLWWQFCRGRVIIELQDRFR